MTAGKGPIRRVLVANRGEIAVRVMRTLRDRGVESVAVFSEADRRAAHVLLADRAICIGPAPAAASYLDIDKVIDACRQSGADAVHPGYGFLSENAEFAEACEAAGINFIGPPAAAMRLMGSKTEARKAVVAASLPVVPGDSGPDGRGLPDAASAERAAREIGFPVLIKAAAGGGGKGMRLVDGAKGFADAFEAARREAVNAFADGTVYIEKAIIRPRHVEIQVFADRHGGVVHLGERDCSVQRRHQKVIEETPSPAVDDALRARMGKTAVAAARACDYVGAGTVEFLMGQDGSYYFLEMNTRLQVEHPITELIYGVDLVDWQLSIAEGQPLPMSQEQLDARRRGAAIECRVYAEDSSRFLPSPGVISHLREPGGPNVRNDSGMYEGAEISMFYDPLISKLVTWAEDRPRALARMRRALDEYAIAGIDTNLPFHRRVLREEAFCAGRYDTGYIDRLEGQHTLTMTEELLEPALAAAALAASGPNTVDAAANGRTGGTASSQPSAWRGAQRGWRPL